MTTTEVETFIDVDELIDEINELHVHWCCGNCDAAFCGAKTLGIDTPGVAIDCEPCAEINRRAQLERYKCKKCGALNNCSY